MAPLPVGPFSSVQLRLLPLASLHVLSLPDQELLSPASRLNSIPAVAVAPPWVVVTVDTVASTSAAADASALMAAASLAATLARVVSWLLLTSPATTV